MGSNISKSMKTLQCVWGILLALSIAYFLIGEFSSEKEAYFKVGKSNLYNDGWEMVLDDGSRMPIKVPGSYDVKSGDTFVIEKKIEDSFQGAWLCLRSSQHDIKIYVDDELIEDYSTKDSRNFGKNSVSVFVFAELKTEHAGKTLRMELISHSTYSGYINEIYCGDREQIWTGIVKAYLPVTILALFMLLLSIMVVIYCLIISFVYKKKMNISYLGIGLLVASVWLIAESKLRQIFLPNSTIASDVGFFMVMLLPLPFLTYINSVQKRRYEKAYFVLGACACINFVGSTILQFAGIKDFSETMMSGHIIIIALIVLLMITVAIDIKKGYIKDYREVALGMGGLMVAGIYEIYMVYDKFAIYNGVGLCIGLAFLFFMAVIQTGRDLLNLEKEKQLAVAASESRTMFLANMSHEIRTPINTIVGMNEMILRENHNNEIKEYSRNIENASKLLLGLIDDILDFSKLDAGKLEICENRYSMAAMLNDVILGMSIRLEDRDLTVNMDIDENLPSQVIGDEIRVKQIFNNILSNAVKYTVEGSITLSVKGIWEKEKFNLVFSVADTGVGIKEEDMATLFDSFRRMDLKRNKYIQGTGLGLSITKQLVENMKGNIKVESEYGKGSCFTVTLPQKIVDDRPMGNPMVAYSSLVNNEDEKTDKIYKSGQRVMVVDDNDMNLTVMKALLSKKGFELELVAGGLESYELCKKNKYSLILMDHMMPAPDGIETLHMIRDDKEGLNIDTPIVALTANAIKGAGEQYKNEGFSDYITKPVEYAKLETVLDKYLIQEMMDNSLSVSNSTLYTVDRETGIKNCSDMVDLYEEILGDFVRKCNDYKKEIKEYYQEEKWIDYARIAHTLKSNALTVGLAEFGELAREHELKAKASEVSFIRVHYEEFVKAIDKAIESVQVEIERNQYD
ncbi:MAG: response regulator [Lachnospiraceae bacterium]|nr:response regulator [Lachnospiraceae bacterium]